MTNKTGRLAGAQRAGATHWSFASPRLQAVLDSFPGVTLLADEDADTVSMSYIEVPPEQQSQGTASHLMAKLKSYCDRLGKLLLVTDVTNPGFFGQLGWMHFQPPDEFVYAPQTPVMSRRIGVISSWLRETRVASPPWYQDIGNPPGLPRPIDEAPDESLRPVPWSQGEMGWGKLDGDRSELSREFAACLVCGEPVTEGKVVYIPREFLEQGIRPPDVFELEDLNIGDHIVDHGPMHDRCAALTAAHCQTIKQGLASGQYKMGLYRSEAPDMPPTMSKEAVVQEDPGTYLAQTLDGEWEPESSTPGDFSGTLYVGDTQITLGMGTSESDGKWLHVAQMSAEPTGTGLGTKVMEALRTWSKRVGIPLRFESIENTKFFNRFDGWSEARLTPEDEPDGEAWYYPRTSATSLCPTCGDPLKGEFGTYCPRCQWTEHNPNIDSDPLSNPPDPTKDMHRSIQSSNRSLYHGTLIDHLPSIQNYGLLPDVGDFTSDAYDLNEDGNYDQGDERPYTAEELGIRPAVYMADKRNLGKAQTAMTAAIARKLNKDYHEVTPQDIAQHGLLVKLKGGEPGMGLNDTGLSEATEGDHGSDEQPYTAEPGDWWTDNEGGVGGNLQFITGPKINQVLNPAPRVPKPQGWSAEQGQLFNTKPQYDPTVTQDRQYSRTIPSHRHKAWYTAVEDDP